MESYSPSWCWTCVNVVLFTNDFLARVAIEVSIDVLINSGVSCFFL